MRGLNVLEIVGVYLVTVGLLAGVAAGFWVSVGLGLLAVAVEGVTVGVGLVVLAGAREAAAKASGQHAGGQLQGVRGAA